MSVCLYVLYVCLSVHKSVCLSMSVRIWSLILLLDFGRVALSSSSGDVHLCSFIRSPCTRASISSRSSALLLLPNLALCLDFPDVALVFTGFFALGSSQRWSSIRLAWQRFRKSKKLSSNELSAFGLYWFKWIRNSLFKTKLPLQNSISSNSVFQTRQLK